MARIKFRIEAHPSFDEVTLPFRKFRAEALDKQLEALSIIIHRKIQDEAPERQGYLKRAIVRKKRGPFNYDIFIDSRTRGGKYEPYVRLGTSAHKIVPRKKRALYWPGAAHPVKVVHHPGTKANPYWDRGLERAEADMDRAEQLIATEIEKELTK